jgi:DNA-binding MarR family transcriptional regulator
MNDRAVETRSDVGSADSTIFSLLHAAHVLEEKVEAALTKVGLSMPKYSVLSELVSAGEPLSLSELATRLSCVRSNMTQLVDRLEVDGVVKRVDDPADRRAVKAAITELGREKQAAGAAEIAQLHELFTANTCPTDRQAIGRLLESLG